MAATATEGNGDMLEAMWKSLTNHIQDVHEGHSELYPKCAHGHLDEDDRDKEWLQPCEIYKSINLQNYCLDKCFSYGGKCCFTLYLLFSIEGL